MENAGQKRFSDFDLAGGAFIVTGGARGLGLAMAEALVEAGGKGTAVRQSKQSSPQCLQYLSVLLGPCSWSR